MADQNKRDSGIRDKPEETSKPSNVFITDSRDDSVRAVSNVDRAGKLSTVPADKKNQKNFMEVGHNSDVIDMVVTALKNFKKQAGDPSHMGFIRIAKDALKGIAGDLRETGKNFKELFSGMFTEDPDELRNAATNNKSINQNEKDMAKKEETNANKQGGSTEKRYRIHPGMVDWDSLKQAGLTRDLLEKKGFLEDLLQGRKSPDTMNLNVNIGKMQFQGEGKVSLQKQEDGTYGLKLHPVRQSPELDRPYRGHVFTQEDKKNLLETGNMGRVVDLPGKDFQMNPSLISLDLKTNELHSRQTEFIYIPDDIAGVKLYPHEKEALKSGEAVKIDGFKGQSGNEFDATIQYDAVNGRIEFKFANEPGVYNKIGGVQLNDDQKKDLQAGNAIKVEDMVSKRTGEKYDSFVKLDPVTNKLNYSNYNPDSPEGAREIIIPKSIGGVTLLEDQRRDLENGKPTYVEGMLDRNNNPYDAFVKLHPDSGQVMRSRFPDGFDDNQAPKLNIPKEMFGEKITARMRADLQDGKPVFLKNARGTDGSAMPIWVKANKNQTSLNTYQSNPDERNTVRTAVIPKNTDEVENKRKSGQRM